MIADEHIPAERRSAIRNMESLPTMHPHPLFRGGWLQTVSIKLLRPELSLATRSDATTLSVPDDHTPPDKLSGFYFPATTELDPPKPLAVVFHGMGGNALSGYMRSMAQRLNDAGHPVLLWNHRGAGRSAESCKRLHHPGFTEDIRRLMLYLHQERPKWTQHGIVGVAFSLGANLMLKYLAETGRESAFDVGISISAPMDMEVTSRNLRSGLNRLFDRYLLEKQKSELLRESAELSDRERNAVHRAGSVWELDDCFTARRLGYDGAVDFYRENSAIHVIDQIAKPTLLLHAHDDPVVDPKVFEGVDWDANDHLFPAMAASGGHTGFFDRNKERWHELAAVAFLKRCETCFD